MKLGIITATDSEFTAISELVAKHYQERDPYQGAFPLLGFSVPDEGFQYGRVLVARCGVGKVNAALVTTLFVLEDCDVILNVGTCGSLTGKTGVFLVDSVVQGDFDLSPIDDVVPGQLPGMEMDRINIMYNEYERSCGLPLATCVTQDKFCTDGKELRDQFKADLVDMECAAICQVAYKMDIPVAIIKTVSDSCSSDEYKQNESDAMSETEKAVLHFLHKYPEEAEAEKTEEEPNA